MATATAMLTLEEFRERYAGEKPYFEYWFGEAIQKAVPTWLHVLLQQILGEFFTRAGYKSGPELELRIDPNWQPKPDVVAATNVELPYPTKPVEVVVEVLSPEDRMQHVYRKCREYERIGINPFSCSILSTRSLGSGAPAPETSNVSRKFGSRTAKKSQ